MPLFGVVPQLNALAADRCSSLIRAPETFDSHAIHHAQVEDPTQIIRYARWRTEQAGQFA